MGTPNPLVIPPNYMQVTCAMVNVASGHVASFSFGLESLASEVDVASTVQGWFSGSGSGDFVPGLSHTYRTDHVEVVGHTNRAEDVNQVVGGDTSTVLPPNCAVKIRKTTGLRGKANKGYMYWPGWCLESDIDDNGQFNSSLISAVDAALTGLQTAIDGIPASLQILHHALSSTTTPTPVLGLAIVTAVRTQRRRLTPRP